MEGINSVKTKTMEFIDEHPRILLITIVILIIIILLFYLHMRGYLTKVGFRTKGHCNSKMANEELDLLINSIHNKQKRKK